jgi:putative DNA primase/helicase
MTKTTSHPAARTTSKTIRKQKRTEPTKRARTRIQLAQQYDNAGYRLIQVHPRSKRPVKSEWPNSTISRDDINATFSSDSNIGVVLGAASSGLIDVDLDCAEAVQLAPYFLPATGAKFGRASAPASHWLYRCETNERHVGFKDGGSLLEIRGDGHQTIFPGSVHESGEAIRFDEDGEAAPVDWSTLKRAASELAAGVLIARHWKNGSRHALSLAIAGAFAHAGVTEENTCALIERICAALDDPEIQSRIQNVRTTFERFENDKNVTGRKALSDIIGKGAEKVLAWYGAGPLLNASDNAGAIERYRADAEVAKAFAELMEGQLIYCDESDKWYSRKGQLFVELSKTGVQGKAMSALQKLAKSIFASSKDERDRKVARGLKSRGRINSTVELSRSLMSVRRSEIDSHRTILGTADHKIFDLARQVIDPDSDAIVTRRIGTTFDPKAKCKLWTKFLSRVFNKNEDVIAFVQRAVGYTLTGSTQEQCLFALTGTGANGKSTFLSTIQKLMSDYASTTPMQTLVVNRSESSNDLARLENVRFVAASEAEAGQRLAEAKIKQLTGGDTVTSRALYKEFFEYTPQFKIWLATNDLPKVSGADEAMWRRIRVIQFPVTIPPEERDGKLPEKLLAELPGIFNWALDGLRSWQSIGLSPPEAVIEATRTYRQSNDSVGEFIDTACIKDADVKASVGELYEAYARWCETSAQEAVSRPIFGRQLAAKGLEPYRTNRGSGYNGICLKPELRDPLG